MVQQPPLGPSTDALKPFVLPRGTGRLIDDAAVLGVVDEAALSRKLDTLHQAQDRYLVVVTLPSLRGRSIEEVALAIGNDRGVGREGLGESVLLVVAPAERLARIEVGCALDQTLTRAKADRLLQRTILPSFRMGEIAKGIVAASDAIIREIS